MDSGSAWKPGPSEAQMDRIGEKGWGNLNHYYYHGYGFEREEEESFVWFYGERNLPILELLL